MDPVRRLVEIAAQRFRDPLLNSRPRKTRIDPDCAAREDVRIEVSEHDVCVCDRRVETAARIGCRAWYRACALRPNLDLHCLVETDYAAAACTDFRDVYNWGLQRVPAAFY